ncbi:leucyl aminopeptidase [Rhizorhabdus dicambivorans]|uniref:Probable cytosol aminopeptidase n=1 Tax=Rhizorhabdus dicambivorans TaxID=1850238 RepID=A0A2A4FVX0_9SPHN|nr:leucyl aminopeptidase [Rhizorhabdus dicambivorans]ATE65328.1 leucyl aminopeptidase [Rhizorhabdus dicambivorans]PCE42344.1 leucyl aminopeptidase [Rhizorhabdus dicambivorans]
MRISFADSRPAHNHALAIVVAPATLSGAGLAALPEPAQALARAAAQANRFDGDKGAVVEFFGETDAANRRLLLVGIGAKQDFERAGAALAAKLLTSGESCVVVDISAVAGDKPAEAAAHLAFGAVLRSWRHDVYRTKLEAKQRPSLEQIVIVGGGADALRLWADREAVAEGVMFTRTLIAEPANILYPESFVERCRPLADLGVKIEVLDKEAMTRLGMGALLGVAQGSVREPRLLVMSWDGTGGSEPPIAFVGKGVTFDTGGISLKPPAGMEDMKWDMGGAGAVAGTMKALALRKAKAHVIGVCGLVENMPDGNAQRPGDVVTSMSGQTIEVINTDAEGRLVLCDALTWVQKTHSPRTIVDLATLTGAMIISLGFEYGGMFANDDELAQQLSSAGSDVGDKLWRMPLGDPYDKLIDSPIADMKNVGPREGGSITAAQFLKRYIDDGVRWAHLDIAGMVWASKPGATWDKGATGYGVRLLDRFVEQYVEKK